MSAPELRLLVSQDIGLRFVVPRALEILEKNPLLESEHFKGDLLAAVLSASEEFYEEHPEVRTRVEELLRVLPAELDKLDHIDFDTTSEAIEDALTDFRRM